MTYYRKTTHSTFDCTYHIIWITKYRYNILVGDIAERAREILRQVCLAQNVEIIRGTVSGNHIHMYVSVPPYLSISKLVQQLKGKSSRKIQQEFPELKKRYWGNHFWAVGYFVRTTGNVTDEMIKEYIENHKQDDKYGDFKVEN
ncbi:IS200/IS605 family transposase [Patescibacteria group bacterium]|nr:IS200/IS605 family transposase [Patescibacteria group bacterium]